MPRCFKPVDFGEVKGYQLHIFCDASEVGYASVAYLRITNGNGRVLCAFAMGKTRLCPVKVVTIPRLELQAAVTSVQLNQFLQEELRIPLDKSVFWTDSTAVLKYINSESRRFHTFVANRIAKIQTGSEPSQWRHIESSLNPADEGSRGLSVNQLCLNSRWLSGPAFLTKAESEWPVDRASSDRVAEELNLEDPEVKKSVFTNMVQGEHTRIDELFERYSSWEGLKPGVAWLLRVKDFLRDRVRRKEALIKGNLSL